MPRATFTIFGLYSRSLLDFLDMKRIITCLCLTQTWYLTMNSSATDFFVAGAVLIHFLGQVELFHACDFSSQLTRIKALEVSSPLQITQGAFSTVQFVKTKSNHAKVYNMFFALLRVHAIETTHDHDLNFLPPTSHDLSCGVSNVHIRPTPTT